MVLECRGDAAVGIQIADPCIQVAFDQIEDLSRQITVTVTADCPRGDAIFELFQIRPGRGRIEKTWATLELFVEGNFNLVNQKLVEAVKILPNATLPDYVAILHVEAPQPDKLRLHGWNRLVRPLNLVVLKPEIKIGLAEFVEKKVDPDQVRGIIDSVSRHTEPALLKWFQNLLELCDDKQSDKRLCIIIADHTEAEIPWEMIKIRHGEHLGAVCRVSRWIPLRIDKESWWQLEVKEEEHSGDVIAYLDHDEVNYSDVEKDALDQFANMVCQNTVELKRQLSQSLGQVGLVYIGCHGIFTYSKKHEIAVGSLENPKGRISPALLEDLKRQEGKRPVLFINACHSARLMLDVPGLSAERVLYGLPEVMMAKLASGYIGTLGPVGSRDAARIAENLLESAREVEVTPAEWLREIRAKAVKELSQENTLENQLTFIYSFMYVYYGNPLAQLKLTRAEKKEAGL
jgi:hypothetical protein